MTDGKRTPWVVGVSGASGTPYAAAVVRGLLAAGESVDLVVSRASRLTLLDETGIAFRDAHWREDLAQWLERGADGKPGGFAPPVLDDVRYWGAGDLAMRPELGLVPGQGDADRARVHGVRGGGGAGTVEGPAPARGERDAQGAAAGWWSRYGRPR